MFAPYKNEWERRQVSDEVMMPQKTSDALALSNIEAMRSISDNVAQLSRRFEKFADQTQAELKDLNQKATRLEAQDLVAKIAETNANVVALTTRVNILESDKDKISGATMFWAWVLKNAPWMIGLLGAAAVGSQLDKIK